LTDTSQNKIRADKLIFGFVKPTKIITMVIRLLLFIFFISTSIALKAQVQHLSTWSDALDMVNNSATAFANGNYEQAYNILQPSWPIADEDIERVVQRTNDLMPEVIDQYGEMTDHFILRETLVGEHLGRLEVLIRCEVFGIRLVYEFYKSPNGWLVSSFLWNERLGDFFD
jgi:hypothetical protein